MNRDRNAPTGRGGDSFRENIERNEQELQSRRVLLKSRPRLLMLVLTNACNLNCIMCGRARAGRKVTLSYEAARKVAKLFPYLEAIDWQGGEVFVIPYFRELFQTAAQHENIRHSIITNGLLLDREWAELVTKTSTSLTFSVDAVTKQTYEHIRLGGAFDRLQANLRMLRQIGLAGSEAPTHHVNVVVMRSNHRELELFPAFCAEHGIKHLRFDFLRPDVAAEEDVLLRRDPEAVAHLRRALPVIRKACGAEGIQFECTFEGMLADEAEDGPMAGEGAPGAASAQRPTLAPGFLPCKLPWRKLCVDVCRNGDIFPDCLCRRSVGNIYESDLLEVWNGDGMRMYREAFSSGDVSGLCSEDCLMRAVDESHFDGQAEAKEKTAPHTAAFSANESLNRDELARGEISLRSLPTSLHLLLTTRCNMRCAFCWERGFQPWDLPETISPEVVELFPTLGELTWQGGEAFLHPCFRELMEEAVRYPDLCQTLLTNGAFLDEKWLELFLKAPSFNVVLPVESVQPDHYARLRTGGRFERLERSLRLLQEARASGRGLKLMLNIIVMRSNARELEQICGWGVKQGFERIFLTPLVPTVPEFYQREFIRHDDAELGPILKGAIPRIRDRVRAAGIDLEDRFFLPPGMDRAAVPPAPAAPHPARQKAAAAPQAPVSPAPPLRDAGDQKTAAEPQKSIIPDPCGRRCLTPWHQLYVGINGNVSSHCACNRTLGRVGERRLRDLWNGPAMIALRRALLSGDYRDCEPLCPRE